MVSPPTPAGNTTARLFSKFFSDTTHKRPLLTMFLLSTYLHSFSLALSQLPGSFFWKEFWARGGLLILSFSISSANLVPHRPGQADFFPRFLLPSLPWLPGTPSG